MIRLQNNRTRWVALLLAALACMATTPDSASAQVLGFKSKEKKEKEKEKLEKEALEFEENAKKEESKYRRDRFDSKWDNYMEADYMYELRPAMRAEVKQDLLSQYKVPAQLRNSPQMRDWLEKSADWVWKTPAHEKYRAARRWEDFQKKEQKIIDQVGKETANGRRTGKEYSEALEDARQKVDDKRAEERETMERKHNQRTADELKQKYQDSVQLQAEYQARRKNFRVQQAEVMKRAEAQEERLKKNHFKVPDSLRETTKKGYQQTLSSPQIRNQYDSVLSALR